MRVLRSLLFISVAFFASSAATAAELAPRTSSASGVTVNVTPRQIAPDSAPWEFAVAFDTHSQDLGDDLLKNAVLVDAQGGRHAPLAWQGAPPGGHHREGVVRFRGLGALPDSIELQIRRPGGACPRGFLWRLR